MCLLSLTILLLERKIFEKLIKVKLRNKAQKSKVLKTRPDWMVGLVKPATGPWSSSIHCKNH
uniref:Uncharacterized protein n=1 Tax=Rhizophora mucronata TaxID=61149 RepID=A0A2P2JV94_RHIMU